MEIEFSLEPEDLEAFTRYHRKLPGVRTAFSLVYVLGIVLILLLWGSIIFLTVFFQNGGMLFGLISGWFGGMWFVAWCQMCKIRTLFKAQCEDPSGAWATQDVRVIIASDQLRTISRGSTTTYQWSVVWHIGLTRRHVYLVLTRMTALVVPRRAFRDAAQCEEFVALARQYQRDCLEQQPKPTGIITSLPPESTAIRRADIP
jgi:hypothetical protein